ncbi:C39 family peptidase [Patescibacteria group bacterium]|nr:C39 family peptidase [Patescibacteria group bacterium]
MAKKVRVTIGFTLACLFIVLATFFFRAPLANLYFELTRPKEEVPDAISQEEIQASLVTHAQSVEEEIERDNSNDSKDNIALAKENISNLHKKSEQQNSQYQLPESMNLAVPFTSQAPHANWDLPYQEACEEAAMLMSAHFLLNKGGFTKDSADAGILDLVHFEEKKGMAIDMTTEETARVFEERFGLKAEVRYDFDETDIKEAIAKGHPVIMPFAGRQLGNPNFTPPGPLYHMLVIKGYTPNVFITNDPGTRNGRDFQYTYKKILDTNHDWNNGDVTRGKKVMIEVYK